MGHKQRGRRGISWAALPTTREGEAEAVGETMEILSNAPFFRLLTKSIREARDGATSTSDEVRKRLGLW